MKNNVYLAMDIETTGQYLGRNAMIELGAVVLDDEMSVVGAFSVSLKEEQREREKRCMDEFWESRMDSFNSIAAKALPSKEAMAHFVSWLTTVEARFGERLVVLSDNPSFDIAWINYYLSMLTDRPMMDRGWNEEKKIFEYRRIWDTDSAFHGALAVKKNKIINWGLEKTLGVQNDKWTNSHHAEEDASNIAANYILFVRQECLPKQ